MIPCDKYAQLLSPYLDNELDHNIMQQMDEHFQSCPHCRKMVQSEIQTEQIIASAIKTDDSTQQSWQRSLHEFERRYPKAQPLFPASVWIGVTALFLIFFTSLLIQQGYFQRNDMMLATVGIHNKYVTDQLDVQIYTNQPRDVEQYFTGKLPFRVLLPQQSQPESVQLIGASLCHLNEVPSACLIYSIDREPASVYVLDLEGAQKFGQWAQRDMASIGIISHVYSGKTVSTRATNDTMVTVVSNLPAERLELFLNTF
jgi:anti-sigma factor RsiW